MACQKQPVILCRLVTNKAFTSDFHKFVMNARACHSDFYSQILDKRRANCAALSHPCKLQYSSSTRKTPTLASALLWFCSLEISLFFCSVFCLSSLFGFFLYSLSYLRSQDVYSILWWCLVIAIGRHWTHHLRKDRHFPDATGTYRNQEKWFLILTWLLCLCHGKVFSVVLIFRNSEAGIQQGFSKGVKTWLLEAYEAKQIWTPFHRDDDCWASLHLVFVHFHFWGSAAKASEQHSYVT